MEILQVRDGNYDQRIAENSQYRRNIEELEATTASQNYVVSRIMHLYVRNWISSFIYFLIFINLVSSNRISVSPTYMYIV